MSVQTMEEVVSWEACEAERELREVLATATLSEYNRDRLERIQKRLDNIVRTVDGSNEP